MLTEVERRRLLVEWNETAADYPRKQCVHELFEEQAERMPDKVAVEFEDRYLTYAQLNAHANTLAYRLTQHGVGPEAYVGLCAQRSLEMIVALLAILKAGAAYVPIDPSYPPERVSYMCRDASVCIVLTYGDVHDVLREADVPCLPLEENSVLSASLHTVPLSDAPLQEASLPLTTNLDMRVVPQCAAYLIYTSGSTGRPKGVVMSHEALVNLLCWQREVLPTPARTLQFTSLGFDVSFQEIFSTWLGAGTLVLVSEEQRRDFSGLLGLMDSWRIERLFVPFAVLQHLAVVRAAGGMLPRGLREVITAGEALQITGEIAAWFGSEGGPRLYNQYGPTEAHVVSANSLEGPVSEWALLPPIGRAISNTRLYVLDTKLSPTPVGVAGDLYIGGVCLSRGYLNRPDLTAERFVADPLSVEPGSRLYRTGDVCRYLEDGQLEFVGRVDHQVKIRGFRIELGEIESVLCRHGGVREAVVLAREAEPGDKQLVAYVVSQDGAVSSGELREHLRQTLPEYMVPSAFVMLEALPLTPNGKVDRKVLPAPEGGGQKDDYVAVRTPIEEGLAEVWGEVLHLGRVGAHESFFELGGHSLLATQVMSRIRNTFQVELPLQALFEAPTIAGLAVRIGEAHGEGTLVAPPLAPVTREGVLPLSFAQQRLWFLDQLEPDSTLYNIACALRLTGPLNVSALQHSLQEIIRRHEVLRTRFRLDEGVASQVIQAFSPASLPQTDLSLLPANHRVTEMHRHIKEASRRPFDLERGPLFRTALLRLGEEEHALLITLHHIVFDGWSQGVLMRELETLYNVFSVDKPSPLPELPIQYVDYAVWQRDWLQGEALQRQISFWREHLAGAPALLELPTDRPRPPRQTYRRAMKSVELTAELTRSLKALGQREGTTLFMTLLTAFQVLLSRYSGQDDIVVGTPIANRTRTEVEGLIGFFVNTLALRGDLSGDPSFVELLGRVRKVAIGAYAHQDLPFEKLVEELQPERSLSHSPLIQVMFNLLNTPDPSRKLSIDIMFNTVENPSQADGASVSLEANAEFDLTLYVREQSNRLSLALAYNTDLFEATTIHEMLGHFTTLLGNIVDNPTQNLSQLSLLTQQENDRLVDAHNQIAPIHPFTPFPPDEIEQSVPQRFAHQAQKHPQHVAVQTKRHTWTYEMLDWASNRVANRLLDACGPEAERVGLLFEKDTPLLAGLLGVLKSGKTCVPLDPIYPRERLAYYLRDCGANTLLADPIHLKLAEELAREHGARVIPVEDTAIPAVDVEPVHVCVSPDSLAYILYTSGSTGEPKGVVQNHRNVLHFTRCYTNSLHLSPTDRLTLLSSYSFDGAFVDIFGALLNGGTLCPYNVKEEGIAGLDVWLREQQITVYHSTPTVYRYFTSTLLERNEFPHLRLVVLGGEVAYSRDLEAFQTHFCRGCLLVNGLGPTESSVSLLYFMNHETQLIGSGVPVGYAVEGTQVLLLSPSGRVVAGPGSGEIGICSRHVALGYWQKPEPTQAAFVPTEGANLWIYRTGDRGRRRSDGSIEFLERLDRQVKVRGFRIELGEIEAQLCRHPDVAEALVIVCGEGSGDGYLVAYVVPEWSAPLQSSILRDFLRTRLAEYMVPSAFVVLDALPLTPNGKVDRKTLPEPDAQRMTDREEFRGPKTSTEAALVRIWEELLNVRPIDVRDNFFELGGHSLLAARLFARIEHEFGKRLPLAILFQRPTLREIAALLEDEQMQVSWRCLVPIKPQGERAPFFCVHAIGGNVLNFPFLSNSLAADQPLYGIQAHGLDGEQRTPSTVEEMASHYIEEMCSLQAKGPYYLGGVSAGGTIAYEMARQLVAKGERVALLALIDAYLLDPGLHVETAQRFQHPLMQPLLRLDGVLGNLLFDQRSKAGSYLVQRMKVRLGTLWARLRRQPLIASERELPESLRRVRAAMKLAQAWYRPGCYAGRVTQFLVRETRFRTALDPRLLASDLAEGGLEVHFVDGDHITMLNEPHVRVLASKLQGCLDRAAAVERKLAEERVEH